VKHSRYLKILEQASETDKQVREKWGEWKENIEQLCWDEASVPPSGEPFVVDAVVPRTL